MTICQERTNLEIYDPQDKTKYWHYSYYGDGTREACGLMDDLGKEGLWLIYHEETGK